MGWGYWTGGDDKVADSNVPQVEAGARCWTLHRWPRNRHWMVEPVNEKSNLMRFPLIHLNYWDAAKQRNLAQFSEIPPVYSWSPLPITAFEITDTRTKCHRQPHEDVLGSSPKLECLAPPHLPRLPNRGSPTKPGLPHTKGKQGEPPARSQRRTA